MGIEKFYYSPNILLFLNALKTARYDVRYQAIKIPILYTRLTPTILFVTETTSGSILVLIFYVPTYL